MMLLTSLLVVGCGIPKEEHDAVVAERNSMQAELQLVKSELDDKKSELLSVQNELETVKSELQSVQGELDTVKSEIQSVQGELESVRNQLSSAQSKVQAQKETMAKARTFAEVVSILFVPALKGEIVNEVELLLAWADKIKATEDPELNRLFAAVTGSGGGDQQTVDLFLYIFETLPKMLE